MTGLGRPPRIFWANRYCLLDASSGASISVRQMLLQLAARGAEIRIQGATIFDSEGGRAAVAARLESIADNPAKVVLIRDGALSHRLVRTAHWESGAMTLNEIGTWMTAYTADLDSYAPDLVMFYGGRAPDWLIASEAKARGIACAAYVANPSYHAARWCRDVDLVLTDTDATAGLYRERLGLNMEPVGKFVDPGRVMAADHARTHITFVTSLLAKGAALVAQIALDMAARRPDIRFEVVEGRGGWAPVLRDVAAALGTSGEPLPNVTVTPSATDMRAIYGRSRLLLAPSLWWESGGRVAVEAMLNGIPVIATERGGLPEVIGNGGALLALPDVYFEAPYTRLLAPDALRAITDLIERLHDDGDAYGALSRKARAHAVAAHGLDRSTDRLAEALHPFIGDLPGTA